MAGAPAGTAGLAQYVDSEFGEMPGLEGVRDASAGGR